MADPKIYRASTTAPVNIAVIKFVPTFHLAFGPLDFDHCMLINIQILGETRCQTQSSQQLLSQRHPIPSRPSHTHYSIMLLHLLRPGYPDPEFQAGRPQRRPLAGLPQVPTLSPSGSRIVRPIAAQTLPVSSAHRLEQQLPHRRRPRKLRRRLRRSRPRNCRPL